MKRSRIRQKSNYCDKTDQALKVMRGYLEAFWVTHHMGMFTCAKCFLWSTEWHHAEGRNSGDVFPSKLDPTTLVPLCHSCHEAETNRNGPKTDFLKNYPLFNAYAAKLKAAIVIEYGPICGAMKYNKNRVAEIIIKMLGGK